MLDKTISTNYTTSFFSTLGTQSSVSSKRIQLAFKATFKQRYMFSSYRYEIVHMTTNVVLFSLTYYIEPLLCCDSDIILLPDVFLF